MTVCYATLASSSVSLSWNTCGRRTSSLSVWPTGHRRGRRQKRQRHPGCCTESSSSRVPLPLNVQLLCVSWRTRSRRRPGPKAPRDGPSVCPTASLSSPCNWGEVIFRRNKVNGTTSTSHRVELFPKTLLQVTWCVFVLFAAWVWAFKQQTQDANVLTVEEWTKLLSLQNAQCVVVTNLHSQ